MELEIQSTVSIFAAIMGDNDDGSLTDIQVDVDVRTWTHTKKT